MITPKNRSRGWRIQCLVVFTVLASVPLFSLAGYEEGLKAFNAKDYVGAYLEWEDSAESGDVKSLYRLGTLHERGLGTPPDAFKAYSLYAKAALQGSKEAEDGKNRIAKALPASRVAEAQNLAVHQLLFSASITGDDNLLRNLLPYNPNLDSTDSDGWTPLLLAAIEGHVRVVEALLRAGADPNLSRSNGATPLMAAAVAGHAEVVRALVKNGADVDAKNSSGTTALDLARAKERDAVVKILDASVALSRDQIIELQTLLNRAGYDVGTADGVFGSKTRKALAAYRKSSGRNGAGVDNALMQSLRNEKSKSRIKNKLTPGESFRDALGDGSMAPVLVVVPDGTFIVSNPNGTPERYRTYEMKAFAIGKYEITVGEFIRFVASTGYLTDAEEGRPTSYDKNSLSNHSVENCRKNKFSWKNPGFAQTENHPVVCVSYFDAKSYVEWLSAETSVLYSIPNEIELRYAAAATKYERDTWYNQEEITDTTIPCSKSNGMDRTLVRANVFKYIKLTDDYYNQCDDQYVYTAPVGSFAQNAFGLHDTHGNVAEFTKNCYEKVSDLAVEVIFDGECHFEFGKEIASKRRVLGGGWSGGPWGGEYQPLTNLGFRVVRPIP